MGLKMMRLTIVILVTVISILLMAPAMAARIDVDNTHSIHLFSGDGNRPTAEIRVQAFYERVNRGIAWVHVYKLRPVAKKDIVLKRVRKSYFIYVGPEQVLAITPADARDYCTKTKTLATQWFSIISAAVIRNQGYTDRVVEQKFSGPEPTIVAE
jgi:hypothetical protein